MFSDHKRITLEISNRKVTGNSTNTCKYKTIKNNESK